MCSQVWRLESFKVKDLPKAGEEWKPNICFNFLTALLAQLKVVQDSTTALHSSELLCTPPYRTALHPTLQN